ncbi:MAG: hypothetical protein ACYTBS_26460 [Planctomycetota bacterium]
MERHRVDFESMPWETPAAGVRCRSYERKGRMEVDFDGRVAQFEAGDGLFIPAGQEHKHKGKVLTDVVRMVLVEDIQSSVGEQ